MQHPDITLLLVHALNAARNYLEERGTIPVFAYVKSTAEPDQLQRIVPNPSAGQSASEVVEQLRTFLWEQARVDGYRAVAIIIAEFRKGSDEGESTGELQVAVDHSDTCPIIWHVPFRQVGKNMNLILETGMGS
jgi:hypothetical protein